MRRADVVLAFLGISLLFCLVGLMITTFIPGYPTLLWSAGALLSGFFLYRGGRGRYDV